MIVSNKAATAIAFFQLEHEITNLRNENAKLSAENEKLKHALVEVQWAEAEAMSVVLDCEAKIERLKENERIFKHILNQIIETPYALDHLDADLINSIYITLGIKNDNNYR